MNNDKFCLPYIDLINENFNEEEHLFIFLTNDFSVFGPVPKRKNIIDLTMEKNFLWLYKIIKYINMSEKIYFHALQVNSQMAIYALNPWIFKKSNWIIWGGDLYEYINRETSPTFKNKIIYTINTFVKGNMSGYITHIKGDYLLAKEWFGASGKYYNCFFYPSNLYKKMEKKKQEKEKIYIQVGTSALQRNNHIEMLDKLAAIKDEEFKIFCPLSYGDKFYAQEINKYGKKLFDDKFEALLEFMPLEKYNEFNNSVDIAVFANNYQQGVGNITSLLGMGKTLYIRKTATTATMLDDLGIVYFDFDKLNKLEKISNSQSLKNEEKIEKYFSKSNLINQWMEIFND